MRKITFVFPKTGWKFERTPYPPLGIGYLAAILVEKGWDVSIIDGQILEQKEYEKQLQEITKGIVGISVSIKQIEEALRVAGLLKESNPEISILLGGPGVSVFELYPEKVENIDLIVKGEAENEIVQILNNLRKSDLSQSLQTIICRNPVNLDGLPYPARELFPLEKYLEIWRKNTGMTSTSMISSRGCPFGCLFCDKHISGRRFRARSPKNVVNEMEYLTQRYKLDDIFFYDDLFVFDRKRVIEICREIKKRKLNISWSAQARVDRIDEEMLQEMRNVGCSELYFGVESGSDRILRYLRKGFTRKQIIRAFEACHKIGIRPGMYLILGVPGESKEDVEDTKNLVQVCRPYLLNFSYLMPFPGTPLFEKTKQWIKHYNFSEWDEMQESIYNFPFEIEARQAHDEIYQVFQKMVKEGMKCSSLQFCCEQ
ncbi:MAG: radical SAM protein [Candidatus Aenigmarchaeota archaeon]|nr:radical SAM protein [Candidatus Aenigmarchaeota archaeon]